MALFNSLDYTKLYNIAEDTQEKLFLDNYLEAAESYLVSQGVVFYTSESVDETRKLRVTGNSTRFFSFNSLFKHK